MYDDDAVFRLSEECKQLGLVVAVMMLRGVTIGRSSPAERTAVQMVADGVRRRFETVAEIRRAPQLSDFRRMYEEVEVNPNRHTPACERLVEMAFKRGDLPSINALVDLYNMVSVECLLSCGAHDLAEVELPIELRVSAGDKSFTALGSFGGGHVRRGEFAYFDARGRVICRLDLVQADFSKITGQTRNALLILEGTGSHDEEAFKKARSMVVTSAAEYCGASAEIVVWPF
jgi:DNA/RNA-binding domain of Phe-tRNA-synthetase-like protein